MVLVEVVGLSPQKHRHQQDQGPFHHQFTPGKDVPERGRRFDRRGEIEGRAALIEATQGQAEGHGRGPQLRLLATDHLHAGRSDESRILELLVEVGAAVNDQVVQRLRHSVVACQPLHGPQYGDDHGRLLTGRQFDGSPRDRQIERRQDGHRLRAIADDSQYALGPPRRPTVMAGPPQQSARTGFHAMGTDLGLVQTGYHRRQVLLAAGGHAGHRRFPQAGLDEFDDVIVDADIGRVQRLLKQFFRRSAAVRVYRAHAKEDPRSRQSHCGRPRPPPATHRRRQGVRQRGGQALAPMRHAAAGNLDGPQRRGCHFAQRNLVLVQVDADGLAEREFGKQ